MNEIRQRLIELHLGQQYRVRKGKVVFRHSSEEYQISWHPTLRLTLQGALSAIKGIIERKEFDQPMTIIEATFPQQLRGMTTHAPYAYAMAYQLGKDKEYRTKKLGHRGWTLLHCGASKDSDEALITYDIPLSKVVRKAIIGAAYIEDCIELGHKSYAYTIGKAIAFPTPIKNISGQQVIFWRPKSNQIEAFNKSWELIQTLEMPWDKEEISFTQKLQLISALSNDLDS